MPKIINRQLAPWPKKKPSGEHKYGRSNTPSHVFLTRLLGNFLVKAYPEPHFVNKVVGETVSLSLTPSHVFLTRLLGNI